MAAAQLIREAHYRTTLTERDLAGEVRKGKHRVAVALFRRGNNIQFQYYRPETRDWRVFHVKHGIVDSRQLDVFEMKDGKTVKFPDECLGDAIAETDITYEDLAMPFLYWPEVTFQGAEEVDGADCWVVRAENPGTAGNYATVRVWIHKKTHSLMRVVGYNKQGKALKSIQVTGFMSVGGNKTVNLLTGRYLENLGLKEACFTTFDPMSDRRVSISYLELENPKASSK
jgi:hypothetical protein